MSMPALPIYRPQPARGFTLIELAVVLVVVALLVGSILYPLGTQVQQRKVAETQQILEVTRQALIGYAMINGRLPRPAVSATDGTERTAVCATEADCTGFVPWVVLGTPNVDAWGKLLRYSVNSNYTVPIPASQFSSAAGERVVKTRDGTGTAVDLATNLPALVLSHGPRSLGTSQTGVAFADSPNANADEDANAAAGAVTFYARQASDSASSAGGEFDDLIVWISPGQLFSQMVAAGKLP